MENSEKLNNVTNEQLKVKLSETSEDYYSTFYAYRKVERLVGFKRNLEFFFYELIPLYIKEKDDKDQKISIKLNLLFDDKTSKYFYSIDDDKFYYLPSQSHNWFDIFLITFINEYNLRKTDEEDFLSKDYNINIEASLKDLMYACYIGEEWVKHLEDGCLDLLSDYYSEEQLDSFKKTLHR